jgi:hypothetical protein
VGWHSPGPDDKVGAACTREPRHRLGHIADVLSMLCMLQPAPGQGVRDTGVSLWVECFTVTRSAIRSYPDQADPAVAARVAGDA